MVAAIALVVATVALPATPALASPRSDQWYLDRIHVADAQRVSRGDGVTIGLLTNGLPAGHPDLGDSVLPAMRVDGGLWDDVEQAPADYPLADDTATAQIGLMTARGEPGQLGAAPGAKVRPIICPGPAGDTDRCMRWLVDSGVDVINFSQAQFDRLGRDFDGIRYALANDVIVVMALHDGARLPPQQRAGVLLVGGVDRDGELPAGVQPDSRVTLRAPGPDPVTAGQGDQIIGLDPGAKDGSGYGPLLSPDGDQVAAALVTGVVALQRSRYPDLTAPNVINRILLTATDRGAPGRDDTYGYGIVDANAAVTAALPDVPANPLGDPGPPSSSRFDAERAAVIVAVAVLIIVAAAGAFFFLARRRRGAVSRAA
ncbi:S8 family serine peptidase [Actinoplanes sp. NPDC049118]|uniref:S8 family serine peptidase n=1 Tax=Actinoplanes sp. NPDC049118 TaxID=3155769 RepID=UPI0033D16C95